MARNFEIRPEDCVAARKDLELKIRLLSAVSIGFRGLEAQLQVTMKSVRNSMFQVEICIGDFGRRLFAFWPECGECFAPYRKNRLFAKKSQTFSIVAGGHVEIKIIIT